MNAESNILLHSWSPMQRMALSTLLLTAGFLTA